MTSDDSDECPLCMEPFEVDDMSFYPCTCGYQICRFCWHRLKIDGNGLCPACRKPYSENPAHFEPLSEDEIIRIKKERRHKEVQKKQKLSENRRHLADVRVVQKNLVFVVGLSQRLADAEVLKKIEYFGRFGKIVKVVINSSPSYAGTQTPSASAYLTYSKPDEALRAIQTVNNVQIDNRVLKASLGTTKYCSHFLKGIQCPKSDCMYLHDLGEEAASFTKEQMSQGKHLDYESKLIEVILHIPRNLQNISTSNEQANQLPGLPFLNTTIPAVATQTTQPQQIATSSTTPPVQSSSSSSNLSTTSNTNISTASNSSTTPPSSTSSDKTELKIKSKTKSSKTNSDKTIAQILSDSSIKQDDLLESDDVSLDNVKTIDSNIIELTNGQSYLDKLNNKIEQTETPIDFNFLSTKTTTSLDLSNNQNILNGRLDNNLLNNNFSDLNLQQEEDLGFDPWGESTKALQDLMKMEKVVTTNDQLDNYENLSYLKSQQQQQQSLNSNIFNLKLTNQDYNLLNNTQQTNTTNQLDEHRHHFQRPLVLQNGQKTDPVKLNSSLYNSLPSKQQLNRESDALFHQNNNYNSLLNDKYNDLNGGVATNSHSYNTAQQQNAQETLEYFNQENYLNKILLKNNLSKMIVPPPGFNNTFNSPISTSSTNSSSSSTSSSVNNSTSTTPALNQQTKQPNNYQKINDSMARNAKLKENKNDDLNSFNLNSDDNLLNTQQNMVNISKNLQETFRSIFPNAHISFGANSNQQQQQQQQQTQNSNQASNYNKNQFMIDEQLLKRNCWPDDPAIVSLNDGSLDKNQQDHASGLYTNQTDMFLQQQNLNFNNLLRKQQNEQQMNTSLLNQFQLLYQQHQLAQLTALKNKQAQQTLKQNQELNNKLLNNTTNTNFFQNMSSNLSNINAIYNNHNSLNNDNYTNEIGSFSNQHSNTTNQLNNYFVIDSNQNIQTTGLNKNNVSSLSLPQQTFMQQFISSITPNSNSE